MSDRPVPHSPRVEMDVLATAIYNTVHAETLAAEMLPTDFYLPLHQQIAGEIIRVVEEGGRVALADLVTSLAATDRERARDILSVGANGSPLARPLEGLAKLRELAMRRRLIGTGSSLVAASVDPRSTPDELAASVQAVADAGEDVTVSAGMPDDLAEFGKGPTEYDWLIDGLMERGDRLVLTASEGFGKSFLQRQMAVRMAGGADPFRNREAEPRRVLLVDCENPERQVRRHLLHLEQLAVEDGIMVPPGTFFPVVRGRMDLTKRRDASWLRDTVARTEPDVLIVGPIYRIFAGSPMDEEAATAASTVLDTIRDRYGCALILEAHSPHGAAGGRRDLRPFGASLWRRWPEFGIGLEWAESVTDKPGALHRRCRVGHWRGARGERRWPAFIVRGKRWPWIAEGETEALPGQRPLEEF